MQLSEIAEYQDQLVRQLEDSGLNVTFGDDLSVLLKTYEAATGTGYVQLPFVLEDPKDFNPYNFWVCFDDGNAPVALTGYRTMSNGSALRRVGEAYNQGALYRCKEKEGWLPQSGPELGPEALFGYIGAGWVHPRFRGHNLAGFIARIAQAEALLRTRGTLAISTAMTAEALYLSGMNLRASGLHHLHVELVLDGYLGIAEHDMRLYLSHSTGDELMRFYEHELSLLREDATIPWLHGHDKTHAEVVLAEAGQLGAPAAQADPISVLAGLTA
ncbi:hypothetical protein [Variovorax sp. KK3]|uniref:hypothetical protein n=1 Tax=Variovorax sp. KK3 TaxID=1855728 RepID=UPI00097C6E24|nr:hypothetical protein [Variovorax sp. KK3]